MTGHDGYPKDEGNSSGSMPDLETLKARAIAEITLQPDMSPLEYATLVIHHHEATVASPTRQIWQPTATEVAGVISEGFDELIGSRKSSDMDEARSILIDYSTKLKDPEHRTYNLGANVGRASFSSWIRKVKMLSGHSLDWRPQGRAVSLDEHSPMSSFDFWEGVYKNTVNKPALGERTDGYVFGRGIERRDRELLVQTIQDLKYEPAAIVFNEQEYLTQPGKLMQVAFDGFLNLLKEAADSGWPNAVILNRLMQEMPNKKERSLFAMIIQIGNQVSHIYQENGIAYRGTKPGYLDPTVAADSAEAVRRSADLMFNLGKCPAGHDPANYVLVGEIIASLFDEVAVLMGQKAEDDGESDS